MRDTVIGSRLGELEAPFADTKDINTKAKQSDRSSNTLNFTHQARCAATTDTLRAQN